MLINNYYKRKMLYTYIIIVYLQNVAFLCIIFTGEESDAIKADYTINSLHNWLIEPYGELQLVKLFNILVY